MSDLFATGRIIDAIVLFMGLEALILVFVNARFSGSMSPRLIAIALLPGLALLLALRAALIGQSWIVIAAFLMAALAAHLADLYARLSLRSPAANRQDC